MVLQVEFSAQLDLGKVKTIMKGINFVPAIKRLLVRESHAIPLASLKVAATPTPSL